jgi:hypothetical protein
MATVSKATTKSLRISAAEAKRRIELGQPALILDVRAPKAWDSSDLRLQGAIRGAHDNFQIDPTWPKDRFTLAYCT